MYNSIWNDIKRAYYSNMVSKIIVVNVFIFFMMGIINLTGTLTHSESILRTYHEILDFMSLSENLMNDLRHPWTFLSYMFVHRDIFHLLWNMLMFYWFGRILGDFIGDHRVLPIYILGGLSGALAVIIAGSIFNFPYLNNIHVVGSSACVMAFAVAAATLSPDYLMRLILLGDVKLKYIVIVLVILDLARIFSLENVGGYVAHLGGVAFGFIYITALRNGRDLTYPLQLLFSKINKPLAELSLPSRPTVKKKVLQGQKSGYDFMQSNMEKDENLSFEERLDHILDKIKRNGFNNLNEEEKEFLQEASKKK